jgi:predicted ArsR family transcriptional regulator
MDDSFPTGKFHRALADEHRARFVDELRRAPRGLDVQELARRVALHPNTVRWHLGVLADAGIVSSRTEGRATPGRPRIVYTLSQRTDAGDEGSHRLLATILTGALAELDDGGARAERAGRAWGRYLVRRPPGGRVGPGAVQEVVELLTQQGFRPELDGQKIHMHHCPYRELAPGVVCSAHKGVIEGALDEIDSGLELDRLDVFVEPSLCTATLCRGFPARRGAGSLPN